MTVTEIQRARHRTRRAARDGSLKAVQRAVAARVADEPHSTHRVVVTRRWAKTPGEVAHEVVAYSIAADSMDAFRGLLRDDAERAGRENPAPLGDNLVLLSDARKRADARNGKSTPAGLAARTGNLFSPYVRSTANGENTIVDHQDFQALVSAVKLASPETRVVLVDAYQAS